MGAEVYANGNAIACKKSDDKVIAAFPDVCLSPPSPPTGPLPIPYPNSSFSKDMKNGSKTVKISGSEVMLKDQSFYKSSPLGDEAATRSFGANVLSHSITGKTYFAAWSMDVKFEGKNVDRHLDLTTSNHSSYPAGVAVPMPAMEKLALGRIAKGRCPCCAKDPHGSGTPMNIDEWYEAKAMATGGPAKVIAVKKLLADARAKVGCTCKSKKTRILPQAPCDVFFPSANVAATKTKWKNYRKKYQKRMGIPDEAKVTTRLTKTLGRAPNQAEIENERKVNHLTPKSAGGCATGNKNLQPNRQLCGPCQALDAPFKNYQ